MKKLILVGLSFIVLDIGGPALAADVAVEPIYPGYGVPVSVAYNWTGFYIGGNLGDRKRFAVEIADRYAQGDEERF